MNAHQRRLLRRQLNKQSIPVPDHLLPQHVQSSTKRRKPKPTKTARAQGQSGRGVRILPRLLRPPWIVLTVIATLAGLWALKPRLSLSTGQTVRTYDPLGTVFVLSNDGLMSLHDVRFVCWANSITFDGNGIGNGGLTGPDAFTKMLEPDHTLSLPCFRYLALKGFKSISADMTIKVEYRPAFYPRFLRRWHESFGRRTTRDENGQYIWLNTE